MNSLNQQLRQLVEFLSNERIKYVVLGGVAVSVYGEPRLTADIDVNVLLPKDKIFDFIKKAKKYGFYSLFPGMRKMAQRAGVISFGFKKGKISGKFDMIIAENILEYNAIERGKIKKIEGTSLRLITPEDLIIHKIASSRPRDLEDLKGVLLRQKGKLDNKYIQFWLKKLDRANPGARLHPLFNQIRKGCA
ncbi:MAG TPA: nucleotidyltransferase [Candidatus Omnitrophota bacterium]|nr:nucleotidyltransferase [Candidatus Omnitrophota bacterium]